jgi:protein-L-isoaspartate(D-aspartate) O-methyltransferase
VNDIDVLAAVQKIPRELFVPASQREASYENHPLPIGHGQTISQPLIIAKMSEALALNKEHRVLEVGTGSGYQTAILARLAKDVFTVERIAELSQKAADLNAQLGFHNVHYRIGDGTLGWLEEAPFDRILVTAAGPKVPTNLVEQLTEGGRLVIPVESADSHHQRLYLYIKQNGELEPRFLGGCRFVPLVGAQGWEAEPG